MLAGYLDHIEQLLNGHDFFGGGFGDGNYAIADMRQAWPVLRERVFQVLLERNTRIRPWAWWRFESSQQRDESISERDQIIRMGVLESAK